MSKFKYQSRESSSARKRAEQWGNDREGFLKDHVAQWKPKDGANCIRIFPPSWPEAEHYGFDVYVHYQIGPDGSQFLDLTKMLKEPDPITEEVQRLRAEGDEEYAKKLDSKKRVLVYLIDRDRPKDGMMLWAMPWTVDKEIALQSYDARSNEALPIDSPDDGYDVIITKTGQKDRTEYSVKLERRSSKLDLTDDMIEILERYPLPECLIYQSYDKINKAFQGGMKPAQKESTGPASQPGKSRGAVQTPATIDIDGLSYEDILTLPNRQFDQLFEQLVAEGHDLPEFGDDEELVRKAVADALGLRPAKAAQPRRSATRRPEPVDEPEPDDNDESNEPEPEPEPPRPTSRGNEMRERLARLREKSGN